MAGDRDRELLQHVLDNPEDDEARLVYADYLSGKGDPRGELINAQVGLAGRINPARRKKLEGIARALLSEHGTELMAAAAACKMRPTFRRGFIDELAGSAKDFASGGAAVIETEPVQRLDLSGATDDDIEAMVAAGLLGRIRALRLHDGELSANGVALILKSASSLGILNLAANDVDDTVADAIATLSPTSLRSLTLNANQITSDGIERLAASTSSLSLESLFVARNAIDDRGAQLVATSPNLANLTQVGLGGNEDISDAGVLAFADPAIAKRITLLDLAQISVTRATRDQMREAYGSRLKIDAY